MGWKQQQAEPKAQAAGGREDHPDAPSGRYGDAEVAFAFAREYYGKMKMGVKFVVRSGPAAGHGHMHFFGAEGDTTALEGLTALVPGADDCADIKALAKHLRGAKVGYTFGDWRQHAAMLREELHRAGAALEEERAQGAARLVDDEGHGPQVGLTVRLVVEGERRHAVELPQVTPAEQLALERWARPEADAPLRVAGFRRTVAGLMARSDLRAGDDGGEEAA